MKKYIIPAALLLLAASALPLAANTITFKLNFYFPRMKSNFWTDEFDNMSFMKSKFNDTSFGFAYEYFLTRELSVVIGLDTYSKSKWGDYKNWVGYTIDMSDGSTQDFAFPNDFRGDFYPGHALNYSVTPIQLSVKLTPLGRRSSIIPYIGAGVGMYIYRLRMSGDLIDFSDPWIYEDAAGDVDIYPIYPVDAYEGESFGRIAWGYQFFGGVMVPIGNRLTLEGEFKYFNAKSDMKQFTGFEPLDLGGFQFSLGINYWF